VVKTLRAFWDDGRRVVQRPGPWAMIYLLFTAPALLLAFLLMTPLLAWFRAPLLLEALSTRSLGLLLEFLLHAPPLPSNVSLAPLVIGSLVWLATHGLKAFLEGGVLTAYRASQPLTRGQFLRGCWHWGWLFLLLNGVCYLVSAGMAVGIGGLAVSMWTRNQALAKGLGVLAGLIGLLGVLGAEVVRAVAVAHERRNLGWIVRGSWSVVRRRGLSLLGLMGITLLMRWLLGLGARRLGLLIPMDRWGAALLLQQGVQVLSAALLLMRWAGEVRLAREVAVRESALPVHTGMA